MSVERLLEGIFQKEQISTLIKFDAVINVFMQQELATQISLLAANEDADTNSIYATLMGSIESTIDNLLLMHGIYLTGDSTLLDKYNILYTLTLINDRTISIDDLTEEGDAVDILSILVAGNTDSTYGGMLSAIDRVDEIFIQKSRQHIAGVITETAMDIDTSYITTILDKLDNDLVNASILDDEVIELGLPPMMYWKIFEQELMKDLQAPYIASGLLAIITLSNPAKDDHKEQEVFSLLETLDNEDLIWRNVREIITTYITDDIFKV